MRKRLASLAIMLAGLLTMCGPFVGRAEAWHVSDVKAHCDSGQHNDQGIFLHVGLKLSDAGPGDWHDNFSASGTFGNVKNIEYDTPDFGTPYQVTVHWTGHETKVVSVPIPDDCFPTTTTTSSTTTTEPESTTSTEPSSTTSSTEAPTSTSTTTPTVETTTTLPVTTTTENHVTTTTTVGTPPSSSSTTVLASTSTTVVSGTTSTTLGITHGTLPPPTTPPTSAAPVATTVPAVHGPALAFTGSSAGQWLAIALFLNGIGLFLMIASGKRFWGRRPW